MAKRNILGSVTPAMRNVVVALRAGHALGSAAASKAIIRQMPADKREGFVFARHLEAARDLGNEIGKVRREKRNRDCYGTARDYYGVTGPYPMMGPYVAKRRFQLADRAFWLPIAERMEMLRNPLIIAEVKQVMRHGAPGGSFFNVGVDRIASYTVCTSRDWRRVNAGKDQWASTRDEHHIRVLPRWLPAIRRLGTATLGRFFILDAEVKSDSGDHSVWKAKLARNGRGYQVVTEIRFLSVYGKEISVHRDWRDAVNAPPPPVRLTVQLPALDPALDEDEAVLAELALA